MLSLLGVFLDDDWHESYDEKWNVHHKFNMTTPTFQTRVDEEDIRKAAIGAVNFSIDDLSKLVRCLVEDYHKQACALLPKGVISVDDLYTEFTRNAVELVNCKDRGYSVFFGTPVINDRVAKCLLGFDMHGRCFRLNINQFYFCKF